MSLVYGQALQLLESKVPRCQLNTKIDSVNDLPDGPIFSSKQLSAALDQKINVAAGVGKATDDAQGMQHSPEAKKGKPREQQDDADSTLR